MENREWEKTRKLSVPVLPLAPHEKDKEELPFLSRPQNQPGKKQNSDHQQGIGNSGTGEKILSIHLSAPNNLLLSDNQRVMSNPTIPKGKLISSNVLYSLTDETPKKPGATSNNPNHPEVKLTDNEANTSRMVLAETNLMRSNLTNNRIAVNGFKKRKGKVPATFSVDNWGMKKLETRSKNEMEEMKMRAEKGEEKMGNYGEWKIENGKLERPMIKSSGNANRDVAGKLEGWKAGGGQRRRYLCQ